MSLDEIQLNEVSPDFDPNNLEPNQRLVYTVVANTTKINPSSDIPDLGGLSYYIGSEINFKIILDEHGYMLTHYDCDCLVEFLLNWPFRRSNIVKLLPPEEPYETYKPPQNKPIQFAPLYNIFNFVWLYPGVAFYAATLPESPLPGWHRYVEVGNPHLGYVYHGYQQVPTADFQKQQRRV